MAVKDSSQEPMPAEGQSKAWKGVSKRRWQRFLLEAPLDVTVLRSGVPDTLPGRSLNLGERGMGAMLAGELVLGESVGVELRIPTTREPLRARAMVRYQDKLHCGLEFIGLSAEQRASIRDWAKDAKALDPKVHLSAIAGYVKAEIGSDFPRTPDSKWPKALDSPSPAATRVPQKPPSQVPGQRQAAVARAAIVRPAPPRRRRGWIRPLIFLLLLVAAGSLVWWRWNRAWEDLESGLKSGQTAAAEKPEAQVPAEVMEKLLVHRVEPTYPPEARQAGLEGIIALDIVIGRDGSILSMRALNGPDMLARAAIDALRWWKFEPYRINGEPAVVETTVAVEFKR
jgi:TonB family protein